MDRTSPGSERWKVSQSIAAAAPFYSWPLPTHIYVSVSELPEKFTKAWKPEEAGALLVDAGREFAHEVIEPLEHRLSKGGYGGHAIVWPTPEYIVCVLITDAGPEEVCGSVATPRDRRMFIHDARVMPIKGPADAERWFRELVERAMSHFDQRHGQWWRDIVGALSLQRFHGIRPFGRALDERYHELEPEQGEVVCDAADLLHPERPKVAPAAVIEDYHPYGPGPDTYLELLTDHRLEIPGRMARAGRPLPVGYAVPTGPPIREAG